MSTGYCRCKYCMLYSRRETARRVVWRMNKQSCVESGVMLMRVRRYRRRSVVPVVIMGPRGGRSLVMSGERRPSEERQGSALFGKTVNSQGLGSLHESPGKGGAVTVCFALSVSTTMATNDVRTGPKKVSEVTGGGMAETAGYGCARQESRPAGSRWKARTWDVSCETDGSRCREPGGAKAWVGGTRWCGEVDVCDDEESR
ncbi:hypothetical protein F5X68DRAFT_7764 [Plectosphaerella plurivora]|uniref:Uncharacterized protein n=1 Tax=Plectosphaerella plurivora TaxID=936078 RepID=A0A9P8VCX0_9PEZI|nr:hypothetical protein F5X68DRAFT_7764 [Plectosphaerella plurivora]